MGIEAMTVTESMTRLWATQGQADELRRRLARGVVKLVPRWIRTE
jgi:hypothetical protein